MTKRKLFLTILVITGIIALIVWLWPRDAKQIAPLKTNTPSPSPMPTGQQSVLAPASAPSQIPPAELQAMKQQQIAREKKVWDLLLATPISFYGKVVDQAGNPIAGANVEASFADTVWNGHTKRQLTTDENGLFHLGGHGLGVVVMVSKEGYYRLKESDGNFGYSKAGGPTNPHPDSRDPAVFVLRKQGATESLVKIDNNIRVSSNGSPTSIDLATGQRAAGNQSVTVEAWISPGPANPNLNEPYDWRCRISVPNGGLIERKGDFNFEAPQDGYQPAVEINAPASLGSAWRSQTTKQYFIKFGSGNFARIEFTMTAEGDRFFTIHSYFNPKQGSRNLEPASL